MALYYEVPAMQSIDNSLLSVKRRTLHLRSVRLSLRKIHLVPWMFCGKDIPLLFPGNMGIDLCRYDGTVPQKALYVPNVHILFQQKRCE